MERLSLERATKIMVNSGFEFRKNYGVSKYYFLNNRVGIEKAFTNGYEVVRFVKSKGATVEGVRSWVDNFVNSDDYRWLGLEVNGRVPERHNYVNVLTGESLGYMTENEMEMMFS